MCGQDLRTRFEGCGEIWGLGARCGSPGGGWQMPWGPAVGACASRAPRARAGRRSPPDGPRVPQRPAPAARRRRVACRAPPPPQCPDAGDVRPPSSSPGQPAPVGASASRRRHHCLCQVLCPLPPPCKPPARPPATRHPRRPAPRGPPPPEGWPGRRHGGGGSRPRLPCRRPGLLLPVTALGRPEPVPGGLARAMAPGGAGGEKTRRPPARPAPATMAVSHLGSTPGSVSEVAFILTGGEIEARGGSLKVTRRNRSGA